jgi:hypothetical protein
MYSPTSLGRTFEIVSVWLEYEKEMRGSMVPT